MAEKDIKLKLSIKTDNASLSNAENAIKKLEKAFTNSAADSKQLTNGTDALAKSLNNVDTSAKKAEQSLQKAVSANDRFRQVSDSVDLAGQAEGGLRAIGGAASAFGAGGVGQAIGGGAEILGLVEALPRLKEAASALPQVIGSAATALGPVGLGLTAVVLAFAAAVAIASQGVQAEADRLTKLGEERLSVAERIGGGLTAQQAEAEIEQNAKIREQILIELTRAQEEYNAFLAEQPNVIGALGDNLLKIADAREAALEKNITDAQAKLTELEAGSTALQDALTSGRIPVDEAVKAEEELSAAREKTATSTDTAKQSEDAAKKKAEASAAASAKAQTDAANQQKAAAEKAAAATKQYANAINAANTAYAQAINAARTNLSRTRQDANTSKNRDLSDLEQKSQQARFDQLQKYLDDEAAAVRSQQSNIEKIRKNFLRQEEDLVAARDFLGLDRLAKQAKNELDDSNQEFITQQKERNIQAGIALRDLNTNAARERQARLTQYSRQLQDANTAYRRELENAATARRAALKQAQDALQAELKLNQQFYQARNQLAAQANQAAGVGGGGSSAPTSTLSNRVASTTLLSRATTLSPTININGSQDTGATQLAVLGALQSVGLGSR